MAKTAKRAWSAQDDIDLLTSIEKGFSIGEIAETQLRSHQCRSAARRLDEITKAADGVFPRETAAS